MDIQMISDLEYTMKGIRVPNWNNQKYCVFDLEATGIEQDTAHITQIGAVIIENGGVISEYTFNTFVKPPKPIPEPVEQFTGIYTAQLKHAPSFKDAYPDLDYGERRIKDLVFDDPVTVKRFQIKPLC